MQLLQICLVPTRPVGGFLDVLSAQNAEDALEPVLVHDVADADEIEVARGHANDQIALRNDAKDEVFALFTFDRSGLDVLDDCSTVVRVNDGFADRESHTGNTFRQ